MGAFGRMLNEASVKRSSRAVIQSGHPERSSRARAVIGVLESRISKIQKARSGSILRRQAFFFILKKKIYEAI